MRRIAPWPPRPRGLRWTVWKFFCWAPLGAAVSLALTGYQFGILNNLFHLPIVAALYDEPQFAGDPFIQSLRYYSSGVWMLLEGSARYVSPYWLFLVLDYLSRLLSFIGLLCCGTLLGVRPHVQRVIFVVVLCFSSLLHGYSYPGNGGLFVNYFTHSEIANGTILLTFYFAARGRFTEALALNGVTFFINAFMAIWTIPSLGLIAGLLLWRRELTLRSLLRRAAAGLAIAVLFACARAVEYSPAIRTSVARIGIDFRRFLLEFYPDHVLFMIASPRHMVALATATVYGFACLFLLGERAAVFRAALWGSVLLYAVGIVLPFVTGLPLLLNFHLIRSSAVIHLLVGAGVGLIGGHMAVRRRPQPIEILCAAARVCRLHLAIVPADRTGSHGSGRGDAAEWMAAVACSGWITPSVRCFCCSSGRA